MNNSRFHIPKFWIFIFSIWSFLFCILIIVSIDGNPSIHHPVRIALAISPFSTFLIFFVAHKICIFAESRNWIYYQQRKSSSFGGSILLDLDIWFGRPRNQVENIRKAREALNEGSQQESEDDNPPEKKTIRHE